MATQIPIKLNTNLFLPLLEALDGIEDCRLNNNYSECVQRAIFFAYRYAFKKRSDLGGLTTMEYVSEATGKSVKELLLEFESDLSAYKREGLIIPK